MKKYAFLVYHADYHDFLEGLRRLGIIHVQQREVTPSEELMSTIREQKAIRDTLHLLRQRSAPKREAAGPTSAKGLEVVAACQQLTDELEQLKQELGALNKEIDFLAPWGDFPVERLGQLEEANVYIHFFVCPQKQYQAAWEQAGLLMPVGAVGPDTYFVVITRTAEAPSIEAEPVPAPKLALSQLSERRAALQQRIDTVEARLDHYAAVGPPALEAALRESEDKAQLMNVITSTKREAGGGIMLLKGFVPAPREAELIDFCEERGIPFLSEKPTPDDHPPVLLKNSAFSRLFEPIGELFALPNYREVDLTPYFAPFFMLFFGFCVGDAGYGLVLLLGAAIYKNRVDARRKPVLTLVQWLGVATVIFGALTGTFFGINLLEADYPFLERIRGFMLDSDQVFQLALALGMVQILFGLLLQARNRRQQYGFPYAVSTYGWIILLLSLLDLGFLKMAAPFSTYTAWGGVALILLFNDPKAGIFGRLGKGVWELYGITGIFGDLLSYIRLFALGISSAILGYVVNDIALQIKGSIPVLGPILFVLFLLVGHGLNLMIASLGAFVHPMRLTFVEFYKNAGFTGGGKPYRPLTSKEEN